MYMIGLSNVIKLERGKVSSTSMVECLFVYSHVHLHVILFPLCMALFLILNFSVFQTIMHMYMQVTFKFSYFIISHNGVVLPSNLKAFTTDWSF